MIDSRLWITATPSRDAGYRRLMRWDKLFDDLESQLEHELSAEELDVEAEEERLRLARLALRDRLTALHESEGRGSDYRIALIIGSTRLCVRPVTFGRDWLSADLVPETGTPSVPAQVVVPLPSITGVVFSAEQVRGSLVPVPPAGHPALSARLGLGFVLRDLCRRRRAVDIILGQGELHGTLDRVGRDHVDLAVHERGAARRESAVREHRMIPLAAVLFLRL